MKLLALTVALLALAAVNAEIEETTQYDDVFESSTASPEAPEEATEIPEVVTEEPKELETEAPAEEPEIIDATEVPEATASEGTPVTAEAVTEVSTEDPNVPHTVCACHFTTGLLGVNTIAVNELANGPLTGFKRPYGKCNTQTFVDCREDCKLLVPTFTHDFDLTVAPFTRRDSDEKSLGARICGKVGTQPYFARVGLRAEVRCDVKESDESAARPNYTSANLMSSKQRLSCVAGLPIVTPF